MINELVMLSGSVCVCVCLAEQARAVILYLNVMQLQFVAAAIRMHT